MTQCPEFYADRPPIRRMGLNQKYLCTNTELYMHFQLSCVYNSTKNSTSLTASLAVLRAAPEQTTDSARARAHRSMQIYEP